MCCCSILVYKSFMNFCSMFCSLKETFCKASKSLRLKNKLFKWLIPRFQRFSPFPVSFKVIYDYYEKGHNFNIYRLNMIPAISTSNSGEGV